jgi:hypothetical protein
MDGVKLPDALVTCHLAGHPKISGGPLLGAHLEYSTVSTHGINQLAAFCDRVCHRFLIFSLGMATQNYHEKNPVVNVSRRFLNERI